jgi:glucose-1-phosphate thymidylyltransferase
MKISMKPPSSFPSWGIWPLAIAGAIGWMFVSYALAQSTLGPWHLILLVVYEIAKAIFIGATAGVFLKYIAPGPSEEEHRTSLLQSGASVFQCGIRALYEKRDEAAATFLDAVNDSQTTNLWMIGISLRDFLLDSGKRHEVWFAICKRLKDEDSRNLQLSDRLKVRILLLDPSCPEGDFRFELEKRELNQGLKEDVPQSIRAVWNLCYEMRPEQAPLAGGLAKIPDIIEVRLYQHGSFAFEFITDSFAVAEQYNYRDKFGASGMPSVQYIHLSHGYEQIKRSYDIVWKHARLVEVGDPTRTGVGRGLRESRLTNIFLEEDRPQLTRREQDVLRRGHSGEIIAIQALSGRFYTHLAVAELQEAAKPVGRCAKIRLLVCNPTTRNAILRAVADSTAIENIGAALHDWNWAKHRISRLYEDIHFALNEFARLRESECDIELRLCAADLSCAMLSTSDRMFVERYAYGRSRNFSQRVTLGGDTVFEYERGPKPASSDERILESAFEVLWDSYSISADDYTRNPEAEKLLFENELSTLLSQLNCDTPDDDLSMVILAAGYGQRISADLEKMPSLKGKPKALLPVGGKPMIEWLLDGVKNVEKIRRITIVTNEKYFDQFQDWQRTTRTHSWRSIKIISDGTKSNDERKGAIGALHFAVTREEIRGSVFVVGGDNFFIGDFNGVIKTFRDLKTGVIAVHDAGSPVAIAGKLGVVDVDLDDFIVDFEEKPEHPKTSLASTLCYVLTKENVRCLKGYVREKERQDSAGEFVRYLVQQHHRLKAFKFKGKWYDIGTWADYKDLSDAFGEGNNKP